MVSHDRSRDRAQLILVGAIALAVVIVGLTVIVNSAYVTQVDTASESAADISDAQEFEYESNKGARSIVLRLNHRHRNLTAADFGDVISSNVSAYGRLMTESYVTSRGSYANVVYHNGSSNFGARIVQAEDNNVTDNSDSGSWYIGQKAVYRKLGWFSMNVDLEETDEERTFINVSNDGGEWVNYTVNRTDTSDGAKLRVRSQVSSGGSVTRQCDPSRDRVLLDFLDGESFTGECGFNATTEIDPPYRVHVEDGDGLVAKYELVYNESVGEPTPYDQCRRPDSSVVDADRPCRAPAVWTANVSTHFVGSDLNYRNAINVTVYSEEE